MMENIFLSFFNTSIIACLPLLAVVLARFAFRRMPKNVTCLLWILVAVRLALPFSLSAPFSLLPDAEPVKTEVLTLSEGEKEQAPAVKPVINNAPVSTLPEKSEPVGNGAPIADNSPVVDGAATPSEAPAPIIDSREEPASSAVTDGKTEESADVLGKVINYAGIAWIAGMVCMALYGVIGYIRLRRRTRVCEKKEKGVWLCDHISEPFILGVFRPRIMLPSSIGPEDERYVLLHERAHISRGDHIWRVLAFALLALHWYNPLVWVCFFLFSRDTELACDERVVRENGEEIKKPYARTLIAYSAMPRKAFSASLTFGGKGIAARLQNMLHYKKPVVWVCVAFALTCAVIALCLMTVPVDGDDSEPVNAPTETTEATDDTDGTESTEPTENTESGGEATESTPTPIEPTVDLDADYLKIVGMTVSELTERYGTVTDVSNPHGGIAYKFENGNGWYLYGGMMNVNGNPTEENSVFDKQGEFLAPLPEVNSCLGVEEERASFAFINEGDTLEVAFIAQMNGVIETNTSTYILHGKHHTQVLLDGLLMTFKHSDSEVIDFRSDDTVEIWITSQTELKKPDVSTHCYHSSAFDFDDETMTIETYNTITVEWLMEDCAYYGCTAVVTENGQVVTEGYLRVGMKVKIYHDELLYGEYDIVELLESVYPPAPTEPAPTEPAPTEPEPTEPEPTEPEPTEPEPTEPEPTETVPAEPKLIINGEVKPEITNIVLDYSSYRYKCGLIPFEEVINELGGTVTWINENVLSYNLGEEIVLDIRTCDFGILDYWDGDTPIFKYRVGVSDAAYSEVCKKIDGVLMVDTFTFGTMLYMQYDSAFAWVNWDTLEVNIQYSSY